VEKQVNINAIAKKLALIKIVGVVDIGGTEFLSFFPVLQGNFFVGDCPV